MCSAKQMLYSFLVDESGQDLIEYALAAALIGLAAIASIKGLASNISTAFNSIGTRLTTDV